MKNRKLKKGFTLVELIVVIAIVAVLAAVSVVSYMAFVRQANESADIQLVKQLNIALQADETLNGTRDTMHEMLEGVELQGFVVENLTKTKSGYDIVWDQEHNRFALLNNNNLVYGEDSYNKTNPYDIWKFADTLAEAENKNYSVYLTEEFGKTGETSLNIKAGLDAGNVKLEEINYTNEDAQEVIIRTNSAQTTLTVNASNDTVKHYDALGKLVLTDIAYDCYYEYGRTAYAQATKGKIVAKEGGEVTVLYATVAAVAAVEDGGTIGNAYCVSTSEAEALDTGYTNFSNSKDGNVTFQYVDEEGNLLNSETINTIGTDAVEESISEQVLEVDGQYVSRIEATGYTSLEAAVEAAEVNDTIVLLKDVTLSSALEISNDDIITLNTNGKTINTLGLDYDAIVNNGTLTITGSGIINSGSIDVIWNMGTLTIDGNCTLHAESVENEAKCIIYNEGALTVKSGIFDKTGLADNPTIDNLGNASLTIYGGTFTGCTIVNMCGCTGNVSIKGGTFISDANISNMGNQSMFGYVLDSTGTLTIEGGTFTATGETGGHEYRLINRQEGDYSININGGTFFVDPSYYVSSGYKVIESNGTWTVVIDD